MVGETVVAEVLVECVHIGKRTKSRSPQASNQALQHVALNVCLEIEGVKARENGLDRDITRATPSAWKIEALVGQLDMDVELL